ncbi:MAG: adenylate/guanylate cyclase domain-containing protein [Saprospiraceae bacterium]
MKALFILLICFTITAKTYSQLQGQQLIDSLIVELSHSKADTNKVKLLNEICFDYSAINPNVGISYGTQSLELAKTLDYKVGLIHAHNRIGINYRGTANYPKALEHYFLGLRLAEEINSKNLIAIITGNIGTIYWNLSDYKDALEYYSKALAINQELGIKKSEAANLNNIGEVYRFQSQYSKALEYYAMALKINEDLNRKQNVAMNIGNMGSVYLYQSEFTKAREYLEKGNELYKEVGNNSGLVEGYSSLGLLYLQITKEENLSSLKDIGGGNKLFALHKAKVYTDSAIVIAKEIGQLKYLFEAYQTMSEIYSKLGDYTAALESHKLYATIKDSVFNVEKNNKLTQTQMQYEFDKKEAASNSEQEKKDIQQRIIRNSITAGLIGSLLFLFFMIRQRNNIRKEKLRSDELLLNILPHETAEELKKTGTTKAKYFGTVTVLFTDIIDFTALSEKLGAQDLVNQINYCYSAFDEIITRHNVEKIKTIGDSYMCAAGLPVETTTHAADIVNVAIEIRDFMQRETAKRKAEGKTFFEVRIGCNSGPVVAGIVGIKKFAYDIWGDTVNIASRMETTGEAGKINISGSTYALVKDKFKCEYRGKIDAKNKGMIDMYFADRA